MYVKKIIFCIWGFVFLSLGVESATLFSQVYRRPVPVPFPKKFREWKYIVIHHTGASVGNEEMIQQGHLQRGMENGMAYHFLIGNGSAGLGNGAVVEGHRWKYQLQGGHCHQDYLNENGIGICLVGNLNRKNPSSQQIEALAKLLYQLQVQFRIPDNQIHGHGDFYGEDTDCPGKFFIWTNLWNRVDEMFYTESQAMARTNFWEIR